MTRAARKSSAAQETLDVICGTVQAVAGPVGLELSASHAAGLCLVQREGEDLATEGLHVAGLDHGAAVQLSDRKGNLGSDGHLSQDRASGGEHPVELAGHGDPLEARP